MKIPARFTVTSAAIAVAVLASVGAVSPAVAAAKPAQQTYVIQRSYETITACGSQRTTDIRANVPYLGGRVVSSTRCVYLPTTGRYHYSVTYVK